MSIKNTNGKSIGGHTVEAERQMDKVTRPTIYTCINCGVSADSLMDLINFDCNC